MPSYKVLKPGFLGKYYHPEGKRRVLHRDKAFPSKKGKEQVPSWLQRIEDEDVAAIENPPAPAPDKAPADMTVNELKDALKQRDISFASGDAKAVLVELLERAEIQASVDKDNAEIEGTSFMAEGEQSPPADQSSTVQTL